MKKQFEFIKMLYNDFENDMKSHLKNIETSTSKYYTANFMDKNTGKTALIRKITFIRQELLNLKKMIEDE